MTFSACSESTTPSNNNKPAAPTNLQATSIDGSSIKVRWDASSIENTTDFKDYVVTVTPGPFGTQSANAGQRLGFLITGLASNQEYTVTVTARNTSNVESNPITIKWASAVRYGQPTTIKLYSMNTTSGGSGLNLDAANGPQVLMVADKAQWDIGIDDKTDAGKVWFGPAADIFPNDVTSTTEMSNAFIATNSLDTTFSSVSLDQKGTWDPHQIDLNDNTINSGNYLSKDIVFFVRTKPNSSAAWHYAKILVKRQSNGKFFDPNGGKYVELQISYQTGDGLPYARPRS